MKVFKFQSLFLVLLALAVANQSCKSKKVVAKPETAAAPAAADPAPASPPAPAETKPAEPAPAVSKPDYNFSNIQFEFDSPILKTDAYPALDKAAAEMKKDPSVKFVLNGYSSLEGTPEHNLTLSVERANAVKTYLVNTGVSTNNLTTKGFGTQNPVASNDTESGRTLNRRVEIKLN